MERRQDRVVFDSNILIAAYNWPGGMADRSYLLARRSVVELHTSEFIVGEVERILGDKFGWEEGRMARVSAQIRRIAEEVHDPRNSLNVVENDPTDNRILECALAADAELLVTGDKKHLLPLKDFRGVSIVSLGDFLNQYESE